MPTPRVVVERLADARLTLVFFLLTMVAAVAIASGDRLPTPWMAGPFGLLVLNLVAAILTHRRLRIDLALLVFHLALLALVVTIVGSRLIYFDGQFALSNGTAFEGQVTRSNHGPLHSGQLDQLSLVNEGFAIRYDADGRYRGTYNRVSWIDPEAGWQRAEIGDDRSVLIGGYRVSAVRQRGLAPLFRWEVTGRPPELGYVQVPDHRSSDYPPWEIWKLAKDLELWVQVNHAPLVQPVGRVEENLGAAELAHTLIVRAAEQRFEIRPGESIDFPQGRLTYLELGAWMGYRVVYDPLANWVMASVVVGIGSLAWFYARRLRLKELS